MCEIDVREFASGRSSTNHILVGSADDQMSPFVASNCLFKLVLRRQTKDLPPASVAVLVEEAIVKAMVEGRLAGGGLPYLVVGHSRGGVTAILFAGRLAHDPHLPLPAGIVAAGSPHQSCNLRAEQKEELRSAGVLESPSSRTGQVLRVGRAWLEEQEADPAGHDVLQNTKNIQCPVLIVHGEEDETVSVESGVTLAAAARNARLVRIPGCNHVFNAPNPPPSEVSGIPQLAQFTREVASFAHAACPTRHGDVAV